MNHLSIQYCPSADSQVQFCHSHKNPPPVWQMPLPPPETGSEGPSAEDRVHSLILGCFRLDAQLKLRLEKEKLLPGTEPQEREAVGRVTLLLGSLLLPPLKQELRQHVQTRCLACVWFELGEVNPIHLHPGKH